MNPASSPRRPCHPLWLASSMLALLAASCIVVHISFPATEVQEAAEEFVKEVRPEEAAPAPADSPAEGQAPEVPAAPPAPAVDPAGTTGAKQSSAWSAFLFSSAWAEESAPPAALQDKDEKPRIDVTTPKILKIKEALKKRYPQLLPFYTKGAFGEARSGYLALRDASGLNLKEKRDADALLKAENEDRRNLYEEIAAANKIKPEEVDRIAGIFSEEWQKNARPGWWIEPTKDKWVKKPKEG